MSCAVALRTRVRLVAVLLCAAALAGCAAGAAAPARPGGAASIPLPGRALLAPARKPDCAFHEIGLGDTLPNAAETERRKLDYERRCYRRAEMQMRARLHRLQAAVTESIKAIGRREQRAW
jgi:hypothetical protein